jgi:hypothetical protein
MQEPTWADVVAYLVERLHEHSQIWLMLLMPTVMILRLVVGALWQRRVQHQRAASVGAIFERWIQQHDMPLPEMSTDEQLAALDRLGQALLGPPAIVLRFFIALQVVMESWHVHERVLSALDGLAQTWHDKLPSERKRRERRAQVFARRDVARLLSRIDRDGVRSTPAP